MAPPTLRDLIDEFLIALQVEGMSPNTIKTKKSVLNQFNKWMGEYYPDASPKVIATRHVSEYILYKRKNGLGKGSEQQTHIHLSTFFKWAKDAHPKQIKKNPLTKIKRPHYRPPVTEFPELDIIEKMVESCDTTTFKGVRDRLLLLLLKETGGRASEILALTQNDFLEDEKIIIIRHGKGGKYREVPYGEKTALALIDYQEMREAHLHSHYQEMFLGLRGPFKYDGLRTMFAERSLMVSQNHLTPHKFRHAFVDLAKRKGVTEDALMELLGWSTRVMLDHYARSGRKQRAINEYREKLKDSRV